MTEPARSRARRRTVRLGLGALAKAALLVLGVPATLVRLWLLASAPGRSPLDVQGALGARLALLVVACGWAVAASALARDVVGALRQEELDPTSWSRRWALRLAALLLMVAAGTAGAATGRGRTGAPTEAVARPPAAVSHAPRPGPLAPTSLLEAAGAVGLGALLGAGLVRRARLLRRATACRRHPGERHPLPSVPSRDLEVLVGPLADATLLDWLEGANRLLWRSLAAAPPGTPWPDVALVRAGPDGIELLMRQVTPEALDGFAPLEGGAWWCLDPHVGLAELGHRTQGCGRLLPALVPIGEDGTATYLLNVDPGRRLRVTGDAAQARRVLAGILVGLRCLPWADELAIELLGIDPPPAVEQCYQMSASSPAELRALLAVPPGDRRDRLGERWSRQLLVVAADVPEDLDDLLGRCASHAGVVSLGGSGTEALVVDETGAFLEPLGVRIVPPRPTPDQLAAAGQLLAEAAASARPPPPSPQRSTGPFPAPAAGRRPPGAIPSRPGLIEARLLDGPPRLVGVSHPATSPVSPRVVELVVHLSLRGGTSPLSDVQADLFPSPSGTGTHERTHRTLAAARAALGLASDGTALVARAPGDVVVLHPEVTCDAVRLADASRDAPAAQATAAESILRSCLLLVGPRAPIPLPAYPWLVASGLRDGILAEVVDAAHHLALLALARGDATIARWAVDRGRLAEPCSELLARDLILACDADGDRTGMLGAWHDLEGGLARLGGYEPSAETRDLLAALLAHPR